MSKETKQIVMVLEIRGEGGKIESSQEVVIANSIRSIDGKTWKSEDGDELMAYDFAACIMRMDTEDVFEKLFAGPKE